VLLDVRQVVHLGADPACGAQRLERGGDHLGGTGTVLVLLTLGFEQLGVGEDDAQLVVQSVEQLAQVSVAVLVSGF
jgi:hypothetical protein